RWSKSQTWSNPPSSAMRHTRRSASTVVSWPESLSPNRRGWVMSVEASRLDADRDVVLLGEALRRPVVALDQPRVFADVGGNPVRRNLLRDQAGRAVDADNVIAVGGGVEVERHIGVGFDVADLLAGEGVAQKRLAVPQEPDRPRARSPAIPARGQ